MSSGKAPRRCGVRSITYWNLVEGHVEWWVVKAAHLKAAHLKAAHLKAAHLKAVPGRTTAVKAAQWRARRGGPGGGGPGGGGPGGGGGGARGGWAPRPLPAPGAARGARARAHASQRGARSPHPPRAGGAGGGQAQARRRRAGCARGREHAPAWRRWWAGRPPLRRWLSVHAGGCGPNATAWRRPSSVAALPTLPACAASSARTETTARRRLGACRD